MKIAIFGDSYSSTYAYQHVNSYEGWPELLAKDFNVENFSENGSCLLYMKKKFDSYHADFDKIIFCVTSPGRIEFKVPTLEKDEKYSSWYRHIPTIRSIESRLKIPSLQLEDKRRYTALYDYFLYVQDEEQEKYIHYTIINDIRHQRPDTIIIPCFPNSLPKQQACLEDITIFEDKFLNKTTGFYYDYRKCHMSYENNQMVYHKIVNMINNNEISLFLDSTDFHRPPDILQNLLVDL